MYLIRFILSFKIIAVVVEGRSASGRSAQRDRYSKLETNVDVQEARLKNSNEVYVY